MDFKKQIDTYKETDYTSTFNRTNSWLKKQPRSVKNTGVRSLYKVAASLLILSLGVVACSLPVDQKEQLGYTIEGKALFPASAESKTVMDQIIALKEQEENPAQINYSILDKDSENPRAQIDVFMILPEADIEEANRKKAQLASIVNFDSIEISPIEGDVERPLYEAALNSFEIVESEVPTEEIVEGINTWIYKVGSAAHGIDSIHVVRAESVARLNEWIEIEIQEAPTTKYKFKNASKFHIKKIDSTLFQHGIEYVEEIPISVQSVQSVQKKGQ